MADLINRQAAIDTMKRVDDAICGQQAIDALWELPSVQSEQKHGHWNLIEDYDDEHWQCSCCGEEWFLETGNPTDNEMYYCPKCGAKMDEEVKQDDS